jgi:cob(I)alamin adenosyltransferase
MPKLTSITTATGDNGSTGLGDGSRVAKDSPIMDAVGSVDELGSALGLALCEDLPAAVRSNLLQIQNDLFDLGADLVMPPGSKWEATTPRLTPAYGDRLECWARELGDQLAPLANFILAGGSRAAAHIHLARSIARRAERDVIRALNAETTVRDSREIRRYLNRLSDLLFQLARHLNDNGASDVLWQPAAGRDS